MKIKHSLLALFVTSGLLQGCTEQKPAVTVVSGCALDAMEGTGKLPDGTFVSLPNAKLKAIGWMADIDADQAPREVTLVLVGTKDNVLAQGSASTGPRPDVATAFNKQPILNSGYAIGFDLGKNVPNGEYRIVLNGAFNTKVGVCDTNKKIKIGK